MPQDEQLIVSLDNEDTQKGKYLTFQLDREIFGIEIKYVTEIIGVQPITLVPEVPDYIKGIINLRGQIIPAVDMRLRLRQRLVDQVACLQCAYARDERGARCIAVAGSRLRGKCRCRSAAVIAGGQPLLRGLALPVFAPGRIGLREPFPVTCGDRRRTDRQRLPRERFELSRVPVQLRGGIQLRGHASQQFCAFA